MNNNKEIYKKLPNFTFFQITVIADLEIDGVIYKDVKQRNNDSIVNIDNWEDNKDLFFKQRMETYKESYTFTEKINSELEAVKKLPIDERDYQILKERYRGFLKETNKEDETPNLKNDDKLTLDDITEQKNSLIMGLPIIEVYNFFKTLVDTVNKKGKCYLTEDNLLLFIKSTFIDLKPVPINFNVLFSKDKISVRSVFKKFEEECIKFEINHKGLKEKYTKIMMGSFSVFNDNDYKKWHETNNKIQTIKIEKIN